LKELFEKMGDILQFFPMFKELERIGKKKRSCNE